MNKKIIILLVTLLGLSILLIFIVKKSKVNYLTSKEISIQGKIFNVELATNPEQWEKGLAYRDSLPYDHGMLFLFPDKQYRYFWMRGMRFPLDILWIDGDTIVDILNNVPVSPETNPLRIPSYKSNVPVNRVLELNAGTAEHYGLRTGDLIHFAPVDKTASNYLNEDTGSKSINQ